MQNLDDEELLARFQADSGAKWIDELFRRYHTKVAAWCYRFTGDRDSAGDLAQEIFLRAYRNLDSFRGSAKFSTWLYTIARNHCMNELRSRQTRLEQSAQTLDFEVEDSSATSILETMEQEESLRVMRVLIEQNLDSIEKKVMVLHFAHGMSLEAVSRHLALTNASGARAHIVSAKRKLARAMERWKARTG